MRSIAALTLPMWAATSRRASVVLAVVLAERDEHAASRICHHILPYRGWVFVSPGRCHRAVLGSVGFVRLGGISLGSSLRNECPYDWNSRAEIIRGAYVITEG